MSVCMHACCAEEEAECNNGNYCMLLHAKVIVHTLISAHRSMNGLVARSNATAVLYRPHPVLA